MTDNDYVLIPGGSGDEGFVALARSQKGRLFKKQILPMNGSFTHPSVPGRKIFVDEAFAKNLKSNFSAGVCPIVQVPIVDDQNHHVEDPLRNMGEVVDLTYDDSGVYAIFDARKHAEDVGTTLLGASALLHLNYEDTRTGQKKGPTLLHMAVTNRPYVTDLGDFEEIVAASAGGLKQPSDTSGEKPVVLIPASKMEEKMDLDNLLATLKSEHGIDVAALQSQAQTNTTELVTALSNVLGNENVDGEIGIKDVADAVIELAEERVALSAQVAALTEANDAMVTREAEAEVDSLIQQGRVLPKQRETMIALSMEDREKFDAILPEDAIVALSAVGVDTHEAPAVSATFKTDIERLSALANGSK